MDAQRKHRAWLEEVIVQGGRTAREVARGSGISEESLSQMRAGKRTITDRTVWRIRRYLQGEEIDTMRVEKKHQEGEEVGRAAEPAASYGRDLSSEVDELRRIVLKLVMRVDDLAEELRREKSHRRHA